MKKALLGGLALLVILFLATACSIGSSSDDETLQIWLFSGMGTEDQIEEYAKEHGLKVNIQVMDYDDAHTNLQTALAAGSGAPDIAAVEVTFIERFKQNPEHFHNLLDLGAGSLQNNYLDWKWEQAHTGDGTVMLGLPTDIGPQAMAYRIDLFEQAGLPTDRDEVAAQIDTWEKFIAAGEQLKEETGKAMVANAGNFFNVVIGQGQQKYFDNDDGLIIENNPHVKYAWDTTMTLIEKGLTGNIGAWSQEWGAGMENGDFAVELAPAWMMGNIRNNAPNSAGKWDIALLPEGSGNWGGSFLTIPAESTKQEEAFALISWLLSPEQQLVTFQGYGQFPSTPVVYDDPAITDFVDPYFNNAPVGQIYSQAAQLVTVVYEGPFAHQVGEAIGDAIASVENGQATPDDAWRDAMEEIARRLDR